MEPSHYEKLKSHELIVVRSLLKKQNEMLGQSLLQLDRLIFLQKSISLLSLEEIGEMLVNRLPYILSVHYFTLFLYDKGKRQLKLTFHNHPEMPEAVRLHPSRSEIMNEAVTSGRYILEQDFAKSRYFKGIRNPLFKCDFFVTLPLMIQSEIIGVLNLNDGEKREFNVADLDFSLSVAEFVALSISNALLYEQTEKLSVTDGLTSLTNRQQMQAALESEFKRSCRYQSPLSLVILDVDHFKNINDTYGHQTGDEVLIKVASILKKACRANDVAARYGGEEFMLILPETPVSGASLIAERIREEIAHQEFEVNGSGFQITVSCGLAGFDPDKMKNASALIKVADVALYRAKEGGRNQTVLGRPDEISET